MVEEWSAVGVPLRRGPPAMTIFGALVLALVRPLRPIAVNDEAA
jgi:hypothetical protein